MRLNDAPRPIVGSQRFRVVESICQEIAEKLGKKPEDFFTIFHSRISQLVDTSVQGQPNMQSAELWRPVVDAGIFLKGSGSKVSGSPALLVFLDRDRSEYEKVLSFLDNKGIPYLFCAEEDLLRKKNEKSFNKSLLPEIMGEISKDKPFNQSENRMLSAISAAIFRDNSSTKILLTGQTVLSAFTSFRGYSHDRYRNQTDSDFLLCTAPPVSIPLLAIEVDGPQHFSEPYWREKTGSQKQARRQLQQELKKTEEKNQALETVGIPVLHIRVDNSTRQAFERHTDTIARVITKVFGTLDREGAARKKKFDYVTSIRKRFLLAQENAFSTNPEIEDLVHIAPELLNWMQLQLEESHDQLRKLQAQFEGDYSKQVLSTPEDAFDYPLAEQNELHRFQKLEPDQLANHLIYEIDWPAKCTSAVAPVEVKIRYQSTINRPLELSCFRETVPWLEMGGYESGRFNRLIRLELARILGRSYVKRLDLPTRESWKSKILEVLSNYTNLAEQVYSLRVIRAKYRKIGLDALQERVSEHLRIKIRRQMEYRGYLKDPLEHRPDLHTALRARLVWVHEDRSRPKDWDPEGEPQSISLDKLLRTLPALDEITQKAVRKSFDDFLESELALYREIPLKESDWEQLHIYLEGLRKTLGLDAERSSAARD